MLKRGQTSQSSKERSQRSRDGAMARYRLMKSCIDSKQPIHREIVEACSSQSGLAHLSRPALGIYPMHLNTLKSASQVISGGLGGWAELESIRRELLKRERGMSREPRPQKPKTLDILRTRQALLEEQLDQERRARAVLVRAYTELLTLARMATRGNDELSQRLKRHLATFGEVGIHKMPMTASNG